jgi:hypothetical protein
MKRSNSYIGTFNYHNPEDMKRIADLREALRTRAPGWRLKLQGRLGTNRSPEITEKYRKKSCNWRGNFCVELKDSGYVDAYLYSRDGTTVLAHGAGMQVAENLTACASNDNLWS